MAAVYLQPTARRYHRRKVAPSCAALTWIVNLSARTLASILVVCLPLLAEARCARELKVPVAPIGLAVTVDAGEVGGIYPDLIRAEMAASGCRLAFQVVPRSRQEMLFETGQADLLVPARRSPRRDAHGDFVPIVRSRAVLLFMRAARLPVNSLSDLLKHRELRVAIVRGFDYGAAYQALVKQLAKEGRLVESADPLSLARALEGGIADVAVITPTAVTGALRAHHMPSSWIDRLHAQPVDDLPWGETGIYVSRHSSLSSGDRKKALEALDRISQSGMAWRTFLRYHPESNLSESVQPR